MVVRTSCALPHATLLGRESCVALSSFVHTGSYASLGADILHSEKQTEGEVGMKVSPYLSFNGNCSEAIALYERAFSTKALHVELYKDAPGGMDAFGAAQQIFDAQLKVGDTVIMLHDVTAGDATNFDGNIMLTIKFDEADAPTMKAAFATLKDGGQVLMDICEVPWSTCFGNV